MGLALDSRGRRVSWSGSTLLLSSLAQPRVFEGDDTQGAVACLVGGLDRSACSWRDRFESAGQVARTNKPAPCLSAEVPKQNEGTARAEQDRRRVSCCSVSPRCLRLLLCIMPQGMVLGHLCASVHRTDCTDLMHGCLKGRKYCACTDLALAQG